MLCIENEQNKIYYVYLLRWVYMKFICEDSPDGDIIFGVVD